MPSQIVVLPPLTDIIGGFTTGTLIGRIICETQAGSITRNTAL